jgi:hypothetical protein
VIVVLAAFLLAAMFAMVAFAIDLGYIVHIRTELQRTADAAALAAVTRLPDKQAATDIAIQVANDNKATSNGGLKVSEIKFGWWDRDTATFTGGTANVNAAKVKVVRAKGSGNPVRLFFAPVLGRDEIDISASAVAMYEHSLCGPLVGIEWVDVPGGPTTDSFRSNEGSYAGQAPRQNGSICSDGPIALDGNPIVNGDGNPGRGQQTTLSGSSILTGNTSPRLRPLNMPDVDASPYEFNNDNATLPYIQKGNSLVSPIDSDGNFLIDAGKTYDMPPGTYYFNDMTLTGKSTLNITGPTTIYLTGNLDTSGGYLINTTAIASNLEILMQGGPGSTAIVTSASDLYAVVYAPQTYVETRGGADFFGAVVGQTLYVTGDGDIHYDENLNLGSVDIPKRVALVQ